MLNVGVVFRVVGHNCKSAMPHTGYSRWCILWFWTISLGMDTADSHHTTSLN